MYNDLFKVKYNENLSIYLNKYTNKVVIVYIDNTIVYTNNIKINEVMFDRENY